MARCSTNQVVRKHSDANRMTSKVINADKQFVIFCTTRTEYYYDIFPSIGGNLRNASLQSAREEDTKAKVKVPFHRHENIFKMF
mmetsp:Transcript_21658/g.28810  ORF Transcript_21658/g.28810 Transcript_21658/m.28810 type:complete len:84 (+) Transcript_21658:21-272(+)